MIGRKVLINQNTIELLCKSRWCLATPLEKEINATLALYRRVHAM